MFGISTDQRVADKVQSQFKPHWLTSNRPTDAIASPAPALPLYQWLAGREVPMINEIESVKRKIKAKELANWQTKVAEINDVISLISPTDVAPKLAKKILAAVRNYDRESASKAFEEHI